MYVGDSKVIPWSDRRNNITVRYWSIFLGACVAMYTQYYITTYMHTQLARHIVVLYKLLFFVIWLYIATHYY